MRAHRISALLLPILLSAASLATAAVDVSSLGRIDFPTSGGAEAREHFILGVLFLHSFEFTDAAEEFREAQRIEPGFAMAYWGESLTYNHPLWRQVDVEAGRAALAKLGPTLDARLAKAPTEREKDFLRSLEALWGSGDKTERDRAYSEALGKMHETYPEDDEISCLYALSILGLTDGARDHRNYMRAASIAEEVFARNPRHPGAVHYLIHSYDDPIHAPLGLRAARVYAGIAPAASHAQHMISHIYVALGRWKDSVAANEKAWKVSQERVAEKHRDVNELDFHSYSWLHYSYLQMGRYEEARKMLAVVEEARNKGPIHSDRAMRARQLVETRRWSAEVPGPRANDFDRYADAVAALESGDPDRARSLASEMKGEDDEAKIMKREAEGLIALRSGKTEEGLAALKEAAAAEDALPLAYGPPEPIKPAFELLGEALLGQKRPAEAKEAFEKALQRAPRRSLSLLGLARSAAASGNRAAAREAYADLAETWSGADGDLPELEEVRRGAAEP